MFELQAIERCGGVSHEARLVDSTPVNPGGYGYSPSPGVGVGSGLLAQGLQAAKRENQYELDTSTCFSDAPCIADGVDLETPGPRTRAYLAAYEAWREAKQHELDLLMECQNRPWQTAYGFGEPVPLHLRGQLDAAMQRTRVAQDAMLNAYMELMASPEGGAGLR